jgi:uncharacterized protein YndB with AHSA1/START domain
VRVVGTVNIAASPDKVWPYLVEPEKCKAWFDNIEVYRWDSDDRGVGSTFWKERSGKTVYELHFRTTEWEENRTFGYEMTSGDFFKSYTERWTLTPTDSGCIFGFDDQIEFPWGPIGKIIGAIAKRRSAADGERMMATLKKVAESS